MYYAFYLSMGHGRKHVLKKTALRIVAWEEETWELTLEWSVYQQHALTEVTIKQFHCQIACRNICFSNATGSADWTGKDWLDTCDR